MGGKSPVTLTERRMRGVPTGIPSGLGLTCQEKPLARDTVPVPQTDTGGQVEETQVDGRPLVKELGKLPP